MKSYILFRSGVFVLGLMPVRSPLTGWLAAASVARALLVLSSLRGDPPFRLYLGSERSERLAALLSLVGCASLDSGKDKKRKTASRKSKACIVALLEPISVDSRARGCDILFAYAERRNEKKSESPELVSRGERRWPPCWIDAPFLVVCDFSGRCRQRRPV